MKLKIKDKWFFHLNLTYKEQGKLERLTEEEFNLLCAYEFYYESPTGQYDDIACDCIAERLYERGLYVE